MGGAHAEGSDSAGRRRARPRPFCQSARLHDPGGRFGHLQDVRREIRHPVPALDGVSRSESRHSINVRHQLDNQGNSSRNAPVFSRVHNLQLSPRMRFSGEPRVVISGIGAVSPFGMGRERYWESISRGCSATRAMEDLDDTFACRVAAPVPALGAEDVPRMDGDDEGDERHRADPKRYSRTALVAVIAAREAWLDAGLAIAEPGAGVVIGSGGGGIDVGERQYYDFFVERGRKVTPYAIPISIVGMVSSEISISLRLRGISHVLSCGCTSSTDAIGYAAALIRAGEADAILSGGADACVTPGMMFGFARMRAVSTAYNSTPATASRPFDKGRDGFVLGEGAWMVVLEREERARARGARIYAAVEVYASTCDAYHRVQMAPDGEEIVRAMALAIERSGRAREEIGYVNYHGTSTLLNDAVE